MRINTQECSQAKVHQSGGRIDIGRFRYYYRTDAQPGIMCPLYILWDEDGNATITRIPDHNSAAVYMYEEI